MVEDRTSRRRSRSRSRRRRRNSSSTRRRRGTTRMRWWGLQICFRIRVLTSIQD
jgi:hypothetical protein